MRAAKLGGLEVSHMVAYSPLGHGFLTGTLRTPADLEKLDDSDFRKNNPRFTGENFQRNLRLADQLRSHRNLALDNGVTRDELAELATHLAFYAGWPAGMSAATTLKQVLDAR